MYIGIDIGSISVKFAIIGEEDEKELLQNVASESDNFFYIVMELIYHF